MLLRVLCLLLILHWVSAGGYGRLRGGGKGPKNKATWNAMRENGTPGTIDHIECMSGPTAAIFIAPGTVRTFHSQNYPDDYPANARCEWDFRTDVGYLLSIACRDVYLEKQDLLKIYDPGYGFQLNSMYDDLSGGTIHAPLSSNKALVNFTSDRYRQASGFICSVYPVDMKTDRAAAATTPAPTVATTPVTDPTAPATTVPTVATTPVTDPTAPATTVPTGSIVTVNPADCKCGVQQSERIVGGVDASQLDHPWIVALTSVFSTSPNPFCAGILIHESWVVTAAHCTNVYSRVKVWLGVWKRGSTTSYTITRIALRMISHPLRNPERLDYDIALIQIAPVLFGLGIAPACLPIDLTNTYEGVTANVAGWGRLSAGGGIVPTLQEVSVTVQANTVCNNAYFGLITDRMVCAGVPQGGKGSCQGDSGGPLTVSSGNIREIVGVVSWGIGCAHERYPGVYSRVTVLKLWMDGNTGGEYCGR